MNTVDQAFEAVLDVLEKNGLTPNLGRDAEDLHEVLRKYIVRCLWEERLTDGRNKKRLCS